MIASGVVCPSDRFGRIPLELFGRDAVAAGHVDKPLEFVPRTDVAAAARPPRMTPHHILTTRNELGEGILWDSRRQQLWWTDIHGRKLHRYGWEDARLEVLDLPGRLCSFALIADSELLLAAFDDGLAHLDPVSGQRQWLARPDEVTPGIRFNDGRVDRHGRFWTGTMIEDERCGLSGSLYSLDHAAGMRRHLQQVRISNGLCTSPDGSRLYFADSPTHTIRAFELCDDGTLRSPRVFARTPEGTYPDGATVDADGCVWSAQWGGSCVVRYTPEGQVDRRIMMPVSQPTCPCFAGPALDMLCVTSACEGLNEEALSAEPHAGAVFVYRVGVQGLPEPEYRSA
jgi:sugar lactone lactonase YvrE